MEHLTFSAMLTSFGRAVCLFNQESSLRVPYTPSLLAPSFTFVPLARHCRSPSGGLGDSGLSENLGSHPERCLPPRCQLAIFRLSLPSPSPPGQKGWLGTATPPPEAPPNPQPLVLELGSVTGAPPHQELRKLGVCRLATLSVPVLGKVQAWEEPEPPAGPSGGKAEPGHPVSLAGVEGHGVLIHSGMPQSRIRVVSGKSGAFSTGALELESKAWLKVHL